MPILPENPRLADFQQYISELEKERGFIEQDVLQQCLLLGEEIGELFKAIRKHRQIRIDQNSEVGKVDEELADILIYICSIANRLDIDLENAFREKESKNKTRVWR